MELSNTIKDLVWKLKNHKFETSLEVHFGFMYAPVDNTPMGVCGEMARIIPHDGDRFEAIVKHFQEEISDIQLNAPEGARVGFFIRDNVRLSYFGTSTYLHYGKLVKPIP